MLEPIAWKKIKAATTSFHTQLNGTDVPLCGMHDPRPTYLHAACKWVICSVSRISETSVPIIRLLPLPREYIPELSIVLGTTA